MVYIPFPTCFSFSIHQKTKLFEITKWHNYKMTWNQKVVKYDFDWLIFETGDIYNIFYPSISNKGRDNRGREWSDNVTTPPNPNNESPEGGLLTNKLNIKSSIQNWWYAEVHAHLKYWIVFSFQNKSKHYYLLLK